jgi:molecular chaperone HtpG
MISHLPEYQNKKFQCVSKGGLDLGKLENEQDKEQKQKFSEEFKDLIEAIQKELGERVKEVRVTMRLTDSPACIVADQNDMTPQMERILRSAGQIVPISKPILEVNPKHAMVKAMSSLIVKDPKKFADLSSLLLDQAVLAEGGQLSDPASFVKRFNQLLLEIVEFEA